MSVASPLGMSSVRRSGAVVAALCATVLLLTGCSAARPRETGPVDSGFLRDYSRLRPTERWPSLLVYRDIDAGTPRYSSIRFEPISIWREAIEGAAAISDEDLQYVADALYQALRRRFESSFTLVDAPAPGTLEVNLALTRVTNAKARIEFFSTAVPAVNVQPRSGTLDPALRDFLHKVVIEGEFIDSDSGTIRAAIVDRRSPDETARGHVETWEEVQNLFDRLAERLHERLSALRRGDFKPLLELRGGKDTTRP
jgi:hypothetical protein